MNVIDEHITHIYINHTQQPSNGKYIYKPELNITTPHLLSKWSFDNHEKVNGANIN